MFGDPSRPLLRVRRYNAMRVNAHFFSALSPREKALSCVLGSRLGGVLPKARGGLERPTAVRRGPKRVLDESQQSAPSRRLWASGLRDQRDFILGRKCAAQLLINCARCIRGRAARNRFLFGADLSFLSHQKIPTFLERGPPWPLFPASPENLREWLPKPSMAPAGKAAPRSLEPMGIPKGYVSVR